jgi:hypothetical protein
MKSTVGCGVEKDEEDGKMEYYRYIYLLNYMQGTIPATQGYIIRLFIQQT